MSKMYLITLVEGCNFNREGEKKLFTNREAAETWASYKCDKLNEQEEEMFRNSWEYKCEAIEVLC